MLDSTTIFNLSLYAKTTKLFSMRKLYVRGVLLETRELNAQCTGGQ